MRDLVIWEWSHLQRFLWLAAPWRSHGVKTQQIQGPFCKYMTCTFFLHSGAGCREEDSVSLSLKHSNRAIYTSRGLWSSIMPSITVNDKNHPLGERYLIAYPVAAASTRTVSSCVHGLGLTNTRVINKLNLTHETHQEAGKELCSELRICTAFTSRQIILSRDRMLLQHPTLQHWLTLVEYKQKQMLIILKMESLQRDD